MIDQQSLTQIETIFSKTVKKDQKPIVTKWRVLGATLFSVFLAWVPFYGYTYLIAKLQAVGFESIDVNPKLYDLVLLFLEGWTNPITNGLNLPDLDNWLELVWLGIQAGGMIFATFFIASVLIRLTELYSRTRDLNSKKLEESTSFESVVREIVFNATRDFKAAFILLISSLAAGFVSVFSAVFSMLTIVFFGALFWLLAMIGHMAGWEEGKKIAKYEICVEREWTESEIKQGFGYSCSQINIEGDWVSGRRVFSDKSSTFFVTNEGAFQVSLDGKILYQRTIHRFEKDEEPTS